ncbi:Sphingomyelinase [Phytophthora ramorum]|uniref:Sphingomyelinase n=1 Tax=Phytophthora ramorum TaxID=164328 RepID=UPI0030A18DDB|nr:Sphingomyelinase [Phytophthora ramorum]
MVLRQLAESTFTVLCYNVAGLPALISSGNPATYSLEMGKRISDWDIVNVQEDFNYHAYLYKDNTQEYRTATSGGVPFGSGLNTLSHFPFSATGLQRTQWEECSNDESADCMTPKGFTLQGVQLADGAIIDVYNLHADAGVSAADQKARASNLQQLSDYITANSGDNAVIIMGDTNTRYTRELDTIAEFVAGQNLTDGWVEYIRKGVPPEKGAEAIKCETANMTNECEVVDKIMFRGNKYITLTLDKWSNENEAFLDKNGTALSDHPPISSTFSWSLNPDLNLSNAFGGPHGTPFSDIGLAESGQTVVYEAGELRTLSSDMVGWDIELESVDTRRLECGVVKQVDCDINCALVLFADGRKEWLDLTFFRVKIPGHQATPRDGSVSNDGVLASVEAFEIFDSGERSTSKSVSLAVLPLSMPHIDPGQFDWHLEATHVELCDCDGQFLEGAALCSKTRSHLQLYNERRGFFEISYLVQGFKAVIHGLERLKTFPMGQIIDVYCPLIGRFRGGTVLKAAVLGHLIPIRFATKKEVEWIDLKSQTFKLVFLPGDPSHRVHGHDSHRSQDLEFPLLYEDQGIEIFDEHSKQYQKYKVAAQSNWSKEAYIFEPVENPAGGVSSRMTKHIVSPLSKLRSRLLLQPAQWVDYRHILVGHRVDVYDRVGRNVMNGKVHAVGSSDDEPTVLVRFKDGRESWIDLRTDKVKLRMHPAAHVTDEASSRPVEGSPTDAATSSSNLGAGATTTAIPAVHLTNVELAQSKSGQTLFRIPSGEAPDNLESSLPKPAKQAAETEAGGRPERKSSAGKRMPALHRRASQSTDVPKTEQLAQTNNSCSGEMPVLPASPASSPSKEEVPIAPAVSPAKPLGSVQSPRLGDPLRPLSPGGPLPPVQAGSNPNSPSKAQLSAGREPNLGLVASDHTHAAT